MNLPGDLIDLVDRYAAMLTAEAKAKDAFAPDVTRTAAVQRLLSDSLKAAGLIK